MVLKWPAIGAQPEELVYETPSVIRFLFQAPYTNWFQEESKNRSSKDIEMDAVCALTHPR